MFADQWSVQLISIIRASCVIFNVYRKSKITLHSFICPAFIRQTFFQFLFAACPWSVDVFYQFLSFSLQGSL